MQVSKGVSLLPYPEGHGEISFSAVISLNWLPKKTKEQLWSFANSAYDSLSIEQIELIESTLAGGK